MQHVMYGVQKANKGQGVQNCADCEVSQEEEYIYADGMQQAEEEYQFEEVQEEK